MAQFLRDVPHVVFIFVLSLVLLGAYVYTRDIAIQTLLISAVAAMIALSKSVPAAVAPAVDATVQGDLNVDQTPDLKEKSL